MSSALFPHLPQQRSAPFRTALLAVAGLLVVLGYLRLTGPFVAVAAAAIPVIYGIYLYEVDVFEHEPIYLIGLTAGLGVVLGTIWALLTGHYVTRTLLLMATPQDAPVGRILLVGVLFPLVAQLLMLVGPLILRRTRPHQTVLDGFSFGAASALGFVFASTVIYLMPELQSGPVALASGTLTALRAILHGLLVPLIDVGTTGLAAAALWLSGRTIRSIAHYGWITSLRASLAVAAVVQVGLGLADVLVTDSTTAILIYLGVAVVLLFWVRGALHLMLLAGAGGDGTGAETTCSNCGHVSPRGAFCPNCGIATQTAPRRGPGLPHPETP
ncbi:MAG: PrsW family intramembrane metalloprotease [Chloroflexi bacterium]|nr:PrsW family intramembrane metalloprotease [Chloroflexota bacterium]